MPENKTLKLTMLPSCRLIAYGDDADRVAAALGKERSHTAPFIVESKTDLYNCLVVLIRQGISVTISAD